MSMIESPKELTPSSVRARWNLNPSMNPSTTSSSSIRLCVISDIGARCYGRCARFCFARKAERLIAEGDDHLPDRSGIPVGEAPVLAVEQIERVLDADCIQLAGERLRTEVKEVLVLLAGVEVDPPHAAKLVHVAGGHSHGVEFEPSLPYVLHEPCGLDLEGQ